MNTVEEQKRGKLRNIIRKAWLRIKKLRNFWIWLWAVISVVFMILIHIAFSFVGPEWLQAKWGAGDILTYASTIALGLLAMWQNQRIQEIQDTKDRHQFAVEHFALFDFTEWDAEFYLSSDSDHKSNGKIIDSGFNGNKAVWKLQSLSNMDTLKLSFTIKNIGNAPANNLQIVDSYGQKVLHTNVLTSDEDKNDKRYILEGHSGKIIIIIDISELEKEKRMDYNLSFWNPFGSHYEQKITVRSSYTDRLIQIDAGCTLDILGDIK